MTGLGKDILDAILSVMIFCMMMFIALVFFGV
jgi:hypothetical protein